MTTRVGINGFGRIGRAFTRLALDRADLEVVAVNDITDARTLAHLLEFDSTYGRLGRKVEHADHALTVGGSPIAVLSACSTGRTRTCGAPGAGKLDGVAVRVPVEDGSLTDLAVVISREATAQAVNEAFAAAAAGPMAGILRYSTDPIVSRDIIGDPASCVFDSPLTQAAGTLVKVFGWYDNEWGYAARLADLAVLVGSQL
jgi:glyceraldehyde-3-phosphate dehydrogenase/erythrose-4-phosphate dehydrogenase